MSKPKSNTTTHFINAFNWSMQGLRSAFEHELAFRQEVLLCLVLGPLGLWLGTTGIERALLVGVLFLALVVEMLNSALEAIVDRIGNEHHDLAGRAKDMGSAAVFLALVNAAIVWVLILSDK